MKRISKKQSILIITILVLVIIVLFFYYTQYYTKKLYTNYSDEEILELVTQDVGKSLIILNKKSKDDESTIFYKKYEITYTFKSSDNMYYIVISKISDFDGMFPTKPTKFYYIQNEFNEIEYKNYINSNS